MPITLKQKEAKTLRFTITSGGSPVDVSLATLSFMVKRTAAAADSEALITKTNETFVKTDAATGVVLLPLSATDLSLEPGSFVAELKTSFSQSNIDKSATIAFTVERAVHGG